MVAAEDEVCITAKASPNSFSGVAPQERAIRQEFLDSLRYLDITREAARRAGEYRYDFARRGQTLSTPDALVAAVAREYSAIIVTDNVRDYPMDDVQLMPFMPDRPL
jgi:predicted nucleic acid-binding protein